MKDRKIIGIDIGGTKMHLGTVQSGQIIDELKLPTAAKASEEEVINQLISGIEQLNKDDVSGIGIGLPGLVNEEDGVVHNVMNIPSWKEVGLKKRLEEHFHKPVYMTNDANCFIIGEKVYGEAKPFKNAVGLTLGTGFGAGILIDHNLYTGTLSSAGELGCIPYLDKTLEDYCSGKFFIDQHGIQGNNLYEHALLGDEKALEILQKYGHHLGEAIKIVMYTFSPQAIFLGGSVSACYKFFKNSMEESIQSFPFKLVKEQLLVECSKVENIAVLGAAALFHLKGSNVENLQTSIL